MKLIDKKDLGFRDGYVYDKATGNLVFLPALTDQVNELVDMNELVAFAAANRTEIEASGAKAVEFKPAVIKHAKFETGRTVATPLADKAKAEAEALAVEFLEVKDVEKIDMQLARYSTIAAWLDKDYILDDQDGYGAPVQFKVNPLTDVTETWVVESVTAFRNPEMTKLINKVNVSE